MHIIFIYYKTNSDDEIKINKPTNKIITKITKEIQLILSNETNAEFLKEKLLR